MCGRHLSTVPKVFVRIGWGKTADGVVLAPPAEQWSPPAAYSKRYGACNIEKYGSTVSYSNVIKSCRT